MIQKLHNALRFARHRAAVRRCAPRLWAQAGGRIVSGPFVGMKYTKRSHGSEWAPKLLGTYEKELASVVEEVLAAPYRTIINIGAGEGYYAVGFAYRSPAIRVVCFERSGRARRTMRALAERNQVVDRLTVLGYCTPASLHQSIVEARDAGPMVLLCDVEGGELELCDPVRNPLLSGVDLLVETHDFVGPSITRELWQRFEPTHHIVEIRARDRCPDDLPAGIELGPGEALAALCEYRPEGMAWLSMRSMRST